VERAEDVEALRAEARRLGGRPFVIAKIERAGALEHLDAILEVSDGIMVARGDLGVEVPIETMAHTQKRIIAAANLAAKPVITATQMLESMASSRLPTRAEATDVANAILDGTDAVMLSGESATGRFPEEAVTMLAKIAAFTESHRPPRSLPATTDPGDRMAALIEHAVETVPCDAMLVPTRIGHLARRLARYKPPVWIVAPCTDPAVCQGLAFSYGVHPIDLEEAPSDWREFAEGLDVARVLLVAGDRIELLRLEPGQ